MFNSNEDLSLFIEHSEEILMDQVLGTAIVDAIMYEGEYAEKAIEKYIEMLENDNVDEAFEEHLSVILTPYLANSAMCYENLIVLDEGKLKMKTSLLKSKLKGMKQGFDQKAFNLKRGVKRAVEGKKAVAKHNLKQMREKFGATKFGGKIMAGFASAKKKGGAAVDRVKAAIASGMQSLSGYKKKARSATTGANNPSLHPAT